MYTPQAMPWHPRLQAAQTAAAVGRPLRALTAGGVNNERGGASRIGLQMASAPTDDHDERNKPRWNGWSGGRAYLPYAPPIAKVPSLFTHIPILRPTNLLPEIVMPLTVKRDPVTS